MKSNLLILVLLSLAFLPHLVWGADFTPLVNMPGLSGDPAGGGQGFSNYINALYRLSISVAALIAVVKIIGAGVKYMFTDIVPGKEEAKKDIRSSLLGLLVVISAVLILSTVNSDLTNFKILLEPVIVPETPGPSVPDPGKRNEALLGAQTKDEYQKVIDDYNLTGATTALEDFCLNYNQTLAENECDREKICRDELKGLIEINLCYHTEEVEAEFKTNLETETTQKTCGDLNQGDCIFMPISQLSIEEVKEGNSYSDGRTNCQKTGGQTNFNRFTDVNFSGNEGMESEYQNCVVPKSLVTEKIPVSGQLFYDGYDIPVVLSPQVYNGYVLIQYGDTWFGNYEKEFVLCSEVKNEAGESICNVTPK